MTLRGCGVWNPQVLQSEPGFQITVQIQLDALPVNNEEALGAALHKLASLRALVMGFTLRKHLAALADGTRHESSLGDAKSSLGDTKSSLGDAKRSLGDVKSSLGDVKSSLGDAESLAGWR
jgi:hypothetical protein